MTKTTTNHEEIKRWAEEHQARPQVIDHPGALGDKVGIRLDFPGKADEALLSSSQHQKISWKEFFEIFESQHLAFVHEIDDTKDPTNAYRFENRDMEKLLGGK